ncbi:ArsR/SmtB family transcription factor [Leifsonia poae]|uniref:ArsR/SmtB family transcription factor n=1 Tax=Leifsonia poae TaxID=110933 RepID=UPI003D68DE65
MVVDELTDAEVDRIFHALADATRRDIVARSLRGDYSVSELAGQYDMSFAAVQKHVAVLERARLVHKRARGRERVVTGDPETIRRATELLEAFEQLWRHRDAAIDGILAEEAGQRRTTRTTERERSDR